MSLARAPFFSPTNNLIPISKTREKEMLCARYEHRTNTDGEQSHYCSTIDAFFLSLFFFKLTLKTLRGKENRWNRLNGRIIVQRLTRIFLLFFFLNLIFISITWHWYQKKKKNAWETRGIRDTEFWFSLLFEATVPIAFYDRFFQVALLQSFCVTVTRN